MSVTSYKLHSYTKKRCKTSIKKPEHMATSMFVTTAIIKANLYACLVAFNVNVNYMLNYSVTWFSDHFKANLVSCFVMSISYAQAFVVISFQGRTQQRT